MKESDPSNANNLTNSQVRTPGKLCERVMQLKSNIPYVIFTFGIALAHTTSMVALTFIVDEFLDSGFSKNDSDLGLLLFNVAGTFGRLLPGLMLQSPCIKPLMVPAFASALNAVFVISFGMAKLLALKLGAVFALGVPFGMFITCLSVIVLRLVDYDLREDAMGVTLFLVGCLAIPSGPLGGLLRDVTGSYFSLWIVLSRINALGLVLLLVACYKHSKTEVA